MPWFTGKIKSSVKFLESFEFLHFPKQKALSFLHFLTSIDELNDVGLIVG